MTFLIVTHVIHKSACGKIYGYAPYVREMNLWIQPFSKVILVAPVLKGLAPNPIELPYEHSNLEVREVQEINLTTVYSAVRSVLSLPQIIFQIFIAMSKADHIHLRCPGNMGLLGCFVQIFFPFKKKTAKYAGNWDPASLQPFTYQLQKKILSSTLLSRNMKALVYGKWKGDSSNVIPFFTASYSRSEILDFNKELPETGEKLNLIFVGSLVEGKNPLIALQSLKLLVDKGYQVHLDVCGDGNQYKLLEEYIRENGIEQFVSLLGNVNATDLKTLYKKAHFLIFLSDSEGWPKVVAEAMFFGCIPITTPVSCVPDMLGIDERGDLISKVPKEVLRIIDFYFKFPSKYSSKSIKAREWSNKYTLELFNDEIMKLI